MTTLFLALGGLLAKMIDHRLSGIETRLNAVEREQRDLERRHLPRDD